MTDEPEKPPEDGEASEGGGETGEDDAEEEGRRPIPVGDLMPSPSPRPARRPAEREGPGTGAEKEEGREPAGVTEEGEPQAGEDASAGARGGDTTPEEPGSAAVPTPVRVAMDAAPPGDSRPVDDLPSREFEAEGRSWVARITGRTVTGTRPDAGALLMTLTFFHGEDPDLPLRSLITVDRPLDALYPEDLEELLGRSRPLPDPGTPGSGARS